MLLTLSNVLDEADLRDVRDLVATLGWRDGAETAGGMARAVKRNQQADLTSRTGAQVRQLLKAKVERHPVLRAAAQPRQFSKLIVSRTEEGGGYGHHVDNPFMGAGESRLRTDFSFTLFLSDPGD
jgi:PKHD-type hydroxylase